MDSTTRFLCVTFLGILPAFSAPTLWINDSAGNLGTVDVATGNVNVIGNSGRVLTDIAFDSAGNLFGVDFDNLYSVNATTGATTLIGSLGPVTSFNALVFGSNGTLYGASNNLYTVNTSTGAATSIGPIGFASAGDLAFLNSVLYLTTSNGQLVSLNTATGAGTLIGATGIANLFGLAAPAGGPLFGVAGTNIYNVSPVTGAASLTMGFGGRGLSGANGQAFIDEAQVEEVQAPEPSTFLLLSGGLVAVAWRRMKRA